MSVDKIIVRSIFTTLLAICVLFVFTFGAMSLAFPSTMMEFTYKIGFEDSSIHFAERSYKDSKDIYYIAYATEVAIETDDNGKIISCGERFIEDEHFEKYCGEKNAEYRQFIFGRICHAKYLRGEKSEAIELAYGSLNGGFPKGNSLAAILVISIEKDDAETIEAIREKLLTLTVEGEEKEYLDKTMDIIDG